jgi:translation initiation factor IF-2
LKADGEVETAARGVNLGRTVHAEAGEGEEEQAAAAEQAAAEQAANEQYAADQAAYEPVVAAGAPAEVTAEAPGTTEVVQEEPGSELALGVEAAPIATPASEAGAPAPVEAKPAAGSPVAKKPPVILPPRPVAPRKSFLKIVEPSAPPPKPRFIPPVTPGLAPSAGGPKVTPRGTPGAPTPDRDGFRVIKMNKEGIDQLAEEEAAKKRGGGGREVEIKPEDVRFADYRKKEMVFLPKKKRLPVGREVKRTQLTTAAEHKRVVEMPGDTITVQDLASQMSVKAIDVVRKLMQMGQMVNINASVDRDSASLVATEFKHEVKNTAFKEEEFIEVGVTDTEETLHARPPVVTIMGHVDHGKTSLLDAIRSAKVAAGEAGGITQHIGAYTVEKDGKLITFVDTPGHEAFTAMRARGANVTDIVILVVAADDGVMPQTREALSHAQAAGVPIIVAVNKIDKPGAQPDRVMQQLSELNLLPEEWGGQTMFVPVSALKQTNLDKLLESVLLQAEVLDLKANPDAQASGSVLEARLEKGRGPVASVLVKRGTLRVGDAIVSGPHWGKVRAMMDDKGNPVQEVTPGVAAEILGFESLPMAGERFDAPESVPDAQRIAEVRQDKERSQKVAFKTGVSLEQLFAKVRAGEVKELGVVLKADVFGSVEAIKDSLLKLSTDKVKVKVLFSAPGGITESDVLLASASDAIIIGFNVRPETKARQMAEAQHVEIKTYSIIYELIDDVKAAMTGMLDKKKVERFLGRAEVRQTFSVPKIGTIAGSSVIDGKIIRGANVRLLRESRIIYEGKMSSLKRFKDDAKEVAQGFECGIGLENYNDLKPGDLIEAYQIDLVAPELGA